MPITVWLMRAQLGHDCVMARIEVEWHTPPRSLVLVPDTPPRASGEDEEPAAIATAYVPETPPHLLDSPRFEPEPLSWGRKRRAASPSMFDSEVPPAGRARSEPPDFKY